MKIARSTVQAMIKKGFQYEEKRQRETLLDSDDERAIIEAVEEDRDLTAAEIARDTDLKVKGASASTIERLLNEQGLKSRMKRRMQDISESNREQRFWLAKRYQRWSKPRLQKIFYSDESNICLTQNGIQRVRKYDDEPWSDERFRKVVKGCPLSINIWMLISYQGVERIKWMASKSWINGQYYQENILARYILDDERLKIDSEFGGSSSTIKHLATWP